MPNGRLSQFASQTAQLLVLWLIIKYLKLNLVFKLRRSHDAAAKAHRRRGKVSASHPPFLAAESSQIQSMLLILTKLNY